jgi:hypothetical protein
MPVYLHLNCRKKTKEEKRMKGEIGKKTLQILNKELRS